jgi:hypothetical protein
MPQPGGNKKASQVFNQGGLEYTLCLNIISNASIFPQIRILKNPSSTSCAWIMLEHLTLFV